MMSLFLSHSDLYDIGQALAELEDSKLVVRQVEVGDYLIHVEPLKGSDGETSYYVTNIVKKATRPPAMRGTING